jgi:hypothetical protein
MTSASPSQGGAMIFAIDEPTQTVGRELLRLADERAQLVVCNAGQALRLIHRHEPCILFVCAARPRLGESAAMIDIFHRRRPGLPLLAVAALHDEIIERAVRSAGAGYYFALDFDSELQLLLKTLESRGFLSPVASEHSPPRSRGAPPIRSAPQ